MKLSIKVYSDYVCPYCFLAEQPLEAAIRDKEVDVEWMPYELRPYPTETLKPEGQYLQTVWRDSVYPMAERMGISIVLPRVSPQPHTHLAFEGYQYARERGKGTEYNDRVLRAFFQEEQDIGSIDVLTTLAKELGLDGADFRAALDTRRYRARHQQALHHAYNEAGIKAVPTFIIGQTVLQGIYPREVLERVIGAEMTRMQENKEEDGASCGTEGC